MVAFRYNHATSAPAAVARDVGACDRRTDLCISSAAPLQTCGTSPSSSPCCANLKTPYAYAYAYAGNCTHSSTPCTLGTNHIRRGLCA